MNDRYLLLIAFAAFFGGLMSALLGWLDSAEPFDVRKFAKSIGFSVLAAFGFAVTYESSAIGIRELILAFIGGAGWDVLTNRFIGAIGKK